MDDRCPVSFLHWEASLAMLVEIDSIEDSLGRMGGILLGTSTSESGASLNTKVGRPMLSISTGTDRLRLDGVDGGFRLPLLGGLWSACICYTLPNYAIYLVA